MQPTQRILVFVSIALTALVLVGLLRRHLHRLCFSFPLYLATVVLGDLLATGWPDRFFVWGFWLVRETVYAVLKFVVALELASLIFRALPGAGRMARRMAVAALSLTLAFIAGTALHVDPLSGRGDLILDLQARLANGTSLLFAAIWAVVLWFRIPLHRWHRAILRGIVPYLVFFTFAAGLLPRLGPERIAPLIGAGAYIAMLAYWTWEAWRSEPVSEIPPAVLDRLQPWRDRL